MGTHRRKPLVCVLISSLIETSSKNFKGIEPCAWLNRRNVWEGSSQGGVEARELRTGALLVHSGDFEDDLVFKVFAYQEGLSYTASAVDSEQFRIPCHLNA